MIPGQRVKLSKVWLKYHLVWLDPLPHRRQEPSLAGD
jgi:hypothetical protein